METLEGRKKKTAKSPREVIEMAKRRAKEEGR